VTLRRRATMSIAENIAENKEIARRLVSAWESGNQRVVDDLASPDLVVSYPTISTIHGTEEFKQALAGVYTAVPDPEMRIESLIAEGDQVVARWRAVGTSRGPLLGAPATGKRVEWTGITIYRMADGKVVEDRGEEDGLDLLRQLGAIPAS
jgi:steroid delta-isomerase-like uncharacterized protein